MDIVVCGAGKVGEVLCRDLRLEGHDITLIERSEKKLQQMINAIDMTGVEGNAALYDVQMEAAVDSCDVFIAVTPSDETNIIAAITARKLGARHVVARVRSPEYSMQMNFLRESMGISMMINPELEAAREISHMVQFPHALQVESFKQGRLHLVEIRLDEGSPLVDRSLKALGRQYGDVLVAVVERGDEVFIPDGECVLRAGDQLHIAGEPDEIRTFYNGGEKRPRRLNNVLIVGGGRLSRYLLPRLERLHVHIKIIEAKEEIAESLAAEFPGVEVICGDGTSQSFLREERIQNCDAVIALTGIDEENLLLAIFAAKRGVYKTITKVNRVDLLKVLDGVGLQSIITPHQLIADHIVRFVRSVLNSEGANIEAFYRIAGGRVEALQFHVRAGNPVCDIPLQELKTKSGLIIASIARKNKFIYPGGRDVILPGDDVLVVTTHRRLQDLREILA